MLNYVKIMDAKKKKKKSWSSTTSQMNLFLQPPE